MFVCHVQHKSDKARAFSGVLGSSSGIDLMIVDIPEGLPVRSYPEVPSSTFSIRPMDELDSVGIDVAVDDVLFNLVTKDTQLMRGSTPWRGGREKDPVLLKLLIESTTHVGDIVLDCTASTGSKFLVILSFMAFSVLIMTLLLTPFLVH
jgi:hypothetical protein